MIHSFWVPALHGKTDLIPGRATTTWIVADRPGTWRGQCGEYCGLQHAHMALVVIAKPPGEFDRWLDAQRAVPSEPAAAVEARGRDIVEQGPCALCHRIAGTMAGGRAGPDLTHFASRATIAAGTVPNTRANLERWLADPQALKPGNHMPATGLGPEDVRAVAAYLDTLR